jgi:hypothetical protein
MAVRSQPLYATYTAWNTSTGKPQAGDAANHSTNWARDGISPPTTNAPTEISNGQYQVLLTTTETTCASGEITGSSSTPNVVLIGITHDFSPAPPAPPVPCAPRSVDHGSSINFSRLAVYTDQDLLTIYRWGLANGAAGTTRTIQNRSVTFPPAKDMLDIITQLENRIAASTGRMIALADFGQ